MPKVTIQRLYELNCENHGVLDANRRRNVVDAVYNRHRQEHPECFQEGKKIAQGGKGQ